MIFNTSLGYMSSYNGGDYFSGNSNLITNYFPGNLPVGVFSVGLSGGGNGYGNFVRSTTNERCKSDAGLSNVTTGCLCSNDEYYDVDEDISFSEVKKGVFSSGELDVLAFYSCKKHLGIFMNENSCPENSNPKRYRDFTIRRQISGYSDPLDFSFTTYKQWVCIPK